MSKSPFSNLLICCLTVLFIVGCTANPATGSYNFTLASAREVREAGDASANHTLLAEGIYRPTSPATLYVNALCNRMYAVTEAAADPVQCNVVDDNAFNAFATPGYLFVNRGLLPFMSSEAELAAVLGHESGHLTARHTAQDMTNARIADLLGSVAVAAVGSAGGGYAAAQTTVDVANQATDISLMTFSRSQETQADTLGRRYMEKAGYDPHQGLTMVRAMNTWETYQQKQAQAFGAESASFLGRLKSSHPATPERIAAALAATGEPAPVAPQDDLSRQRYMAAIDGLAYGPARRYGIARKNELVLTRQRVLIPLPEGTTTDYLSSEDHDRLGTWLVGHPQSGVYLRVTSLKVATGRNPASMVKDMLPFLHTPVMRVTIGDEPANTATVPENTSVPHAPEDDEATSDAAADAILDDNQTAAVPQVIGYTATYHYLNSAKYYRTVAFGAATRANEMIFVTAIYPNEATMQREDANLMSILHGVRFLTRDQSLKYKQLELHTFAAAIGQNVAQQAAHLPTGALQEDLFRALNNLPAPAEMTPGQLYKTILDPNP